MRAQWEHLAVNGVVGAVPLGPVPHGSSEPVVVPATKSSEDPSGVGGPGDSGGASGPSAPSDPAALAALAEDLTSECLEAVLLGLDLDPSVLPEPSALKLVVRALLDRLVASAPGRSVEVRIPPYAAAQCVAGPRHTRGTPPNTVEADPLTWVAVATGRVDWHDAVAQGRIRASGERADLTPYLPLAADNRDEGKGRQHPLNPLS